jgi:hypothetical protein
MMITELSPYDGFSRASYSSGTKLAGWKSPAATSGVLLVLMIPNFIAFLIDPRVLNGATLWWKPFHFEMSLALHLLTLVALFPLLQPDWRNSRLIRWTALVTAFSAMLELLYIAFKAAEGRASHFNYSTPAEGIAYGLMGVGSVILVTGSAVLGFAILRGAKADVGPALKFGAAWGLILGSLSTLIVAGYMSSQFATGHLVGAPPLTDANGLPFLGWAMRSGDLRVPHFFATHAMQVLPIAGLIADRIGLGRVGWVMPAGSTVYFAIVLGLFVQARMGLPVLPL